MSTLKISRSTRKSGNIENDSKCTELVRSSNRLILSNAILELKLIENYMKDVHIRN